MRRISAAKVRENQAGLTYNSAFNGAEQEGAGTYQMRIKSGRHNSTARAFLRSAVKRKNPQLLTRAQGTRVIIEGRRSVGVEKLEGAQRHNLRASGKVILSGGAIDSPQLSGIGPAGLLAANGIPMACEFANVGAHLGDYQGINYTWRMQVRAYNDILRPWWGKTFDGAHHLLTRGGPLAKSINHGGVFSEHGLTSRPNMRCISKPSQTCCPKQEGGRC